MSSFHFSSEVRCHAELIGSHVLKQLIFSRVQFLWMYLLKVCYFQLRCWEGKKKSSVLFWLPDYCWIYGHKQGVWWCGKGQPFPRINWEFCNSSMVRGVHRCAVWCLISAGSLAMKGKEAAWVAVWRSLVQMCLDITSAFLFGAYMEPIERSCWREVFNAYVCVFPVGGE